MTSIQEQIKLERRMVSGGIQRYEHAQSAAEAHGRGSDTKYAQKLLHSFVQPVAESIAEMLAETGAGRHAKYKTFLRGIDPVVAAFIALKAVFNSFIQESSVATVSNHIGTALEDEVKFTSFQNEYGPYYDEIIRDFKRKGTSSYRHMHRVLTMKAKEKNVHHVPWDLTTRIAVGSRLIGCIMSATDLLEQGTKRTAKRHAQATIRPTQAALDWMYKFNHAAALLYPDHLPCIIEPDPWISFDQGGYYTPHMRSRTPAVKTGNPTQIKLLRGDISNTLLALNAAQETPWQINCDILEVLKDVWENGLGMGLPNSQPCVFPASPYPDIRIKDMTSDQLELFENWKQEMRTLHTMEKERVSKCFQVIRCLRLAQEYRDYDRFWFVYQCDFRGRIYATVSGLSPQSADFAKGLLRFADGKTLGEHGAYWLKVHGANQYGKDKSPFGDRVDWVEQNSTLISECAANPLSHRDFWGNADKPWQFLAFCFEYARYLREGESMQSHLPIGLDGSCNGLQNFSALLRDPVGGAATNLVPADRPSDIYAEVAAVCTGHIRAADGPLRDLWVEYLDKQENASLPRVCAKKPVMTLPYGSTQRTCRDSIFEWMVANNIMESKDRSKAATYLSGVLWKSISEVVIAARDAMDWLQCAASVLAKANKPIIWWSPVGFPVVQDRRKQDTLRVRTHLMGSIQLRLAVDNKQIDPFKQRLGISPNFVHSVDAAHLMRTIQRGKDRGITHWSVIHDDFGTHATDVQILYEELRKAFVEIHSTDLLHEFKVLHEDTFGVQLPPLPKLGSLKLEQVLDSKYFFA